MNSAQGGFRRYYQAPIPAIIAVLIVYFWQGLGHFVMYMMEHSWFKEGVLQAAVVIGLVGAVMIYVGRNKSENVATLLGFVGGSLDLAVLDRVQLRLRRGRSRRVSPCSGEPRRRWPNTA
jgi:hypothetical protein